jgi:hypothetical protein
MDGWQAFRQPRLWLLLAGLAVVVGSVSGSAWDGSLQMGCLIRLSGRLVDRDPPVGRHILRNGHRAGQENLRATPDWTHVLILVGMGVLQPFLPAALIDNAAPIWRGIAIWRALGWTIFLPFLLAAPFLAWGKNGWRGLAQGLSLVVWLGILLASLRSGGDTWDNPRYRVAFIGLQTALVAWVWVEGRQQANPWLRRVAIAVGLMLVWFLPWYLHRYTSFIWPVTDLFQTIGLGVVSVGLYLVWSKAHQMRVEKEEESIKSKGSK